MSCLFCSKMLSQRYRILACSVVNGLLNCQLNWWKQFIQLDHTKNLLLNGSKKLRLVNKHERNESYYLLSAANLAKVGYRDQDILALINYIRFHCIHCKTLESMKELKQINLLAFLKFCECAGALCPRE